ncbi:MAG: Coenzyme F420 hydrogenase/dehydrogenase, beta subunit C-terminal domain [Lachnospiraceae bacterium]|nr:Coenzyme F420 hydrogenase/dehydrogenase, beta subunit C-terminal domain [Lachnospiraceae bacterium]
MRKKLREQGLMLHKEKTSGTILEKLRQQKFSNIEKLKGYIYEQLEAQGDCTRRSVENIRGTIDGNMGTIRDKLDHRISLEVEEYREQIREGDLQPPITAQFDGKKVVKYPCDPRYCTGCQTCIQICPVYAIKKKVDDEGFYRIEIDEERCTGCGKCIDVCHVNVPKQLLLRTPKQLLACINKDSEIREKSSSGGVFSELAKAVIYQGGIVFGARMDENLIVSHIGIDREEQIARLRGSKYVQSDLKDTFCKVKEYIAQNKRVLFSGTPCQVAALKRYIGYSQNLYTVDIVCHGVTSPQFFEDYKKQLEILYGPIKSISFRDKAAGWENYSINVEFENRDRFLKQRFQEPFTNGFLKELINAEVCHRCQYARGERSGDITLADFWGFQEKEKKILNDDKGISACMINSMKGMELYHMIEDKLVSEEREYESLKNCNRPLKNPSLKNPDRENFWRDYREFGFCYVCENWLK